MLNLFESLSSYVKFNQKVVIDDSVFKLHSKVTFLALLACSILVTSTQYIGDPIDCIVDEVPFDVMDTYCWIYSTFTVTNKMEERVGIDVVQPGVSMQHDKSLIKRHNYYQWVCFVLFFQAVLFYLPHHLWKICETGKIKALVCGLEFKLSQNSDNKQRTKVISTYYENYKNENCHYMEKYIACECLNWLNVTLQVVLVDYFLGWEFTEYGFKVFDMINDDPEHRSDPMAALFPKVTKCTFHKYGPTGTIQNIDGLCILPVNIINEKIYLFLWCWFAILFIITSLSLVYRILWLADSYWRKREITSRCLFINTKLYFPIACKKNPKVCSCSASLDDDNTQTSSNNENSIENQKIKPNPIIKKGDIEKLCEKMNRRNIFFLYLIGRNTDPVIFNQILAKVKKIEDSKTGESSNEDIKKDKKEVTTNEDSKTGKREGSANDDIKNPKSNSLDKGDSKNELTPKPSDEQTYMASQKPLVKLFQQLKPAKPPSRNDSELKKEDSKN